MTDDRDSAFDIFKFLKISQREDVLHTPMLAGLLTPFGPHRLGKSFLGRFLQALSSPTLPLSRDHAETHQWIVSQEHQLPGTRYRLDILLLCRELGIAIAIENKINAPVRREQLACYLQWLSTLSAHFKAMRLFLLTILGEPTGVSGCGSLGYRQNTADFERIFERRVVAGGRISRVCKQSRQLVRVPEPSWQSANIKSKGLFNLFRFLRIARREAVLHTKMLAQLLDAEIPAHGLGNQFLLRFLQLLLNAECVNEGAKSKWKVEPEKQILSGRIDILLRCEEHGILIAIENKIDAGLGLNQLRRYYDWMITEPGYMKHIPVFLTIDGNAPPPEDQPSDLRLLSYRQILPVVQNCCSKTTSRSFEPVLKQYASVLTGIVTRPARSRSRMGSRVVIDEYNRQAALEFLSNLIDQWSDLPRGVSARPDVLGNLVPRLARDTRFHGHYHAVEIWHKELLPSGREDIILLMIETNLGNKRMMGLRLGLHWREHWRTCSSLSPRDGRNQRATAMKWLQLREAAQLVDLTTSVYGEVCPDLQRGNWVAIAERLEYTRTDEGLIAVLQHHGPELQQLIVSRILEIWSFCGREVLKLNQKLLSLQSAS